MHVRALRHEQISVGSAPGASDGRDPLSGIGGGERIGAGEGGRRCRWPRWNCKQVGWLSNRHGQPLRGVEERWEFGPCPFHRTLIPENGSGADIVGITLRLAHGAPPPLSSSRAHVPAAPFVHRHRPQVSATRIDVVCMSPQHLAYSLLLRRIPAATCRGQDVAKDGDT